MLNIIRVTGNSRWAQQ